MITPQGIHVSDSVETICDGFCTQYLFLFRSICFHSYEFQRFLSWDSGDEHETFIPNFLDYYYFILIF